MLFTRSLSSAPRSADAELVTRARSGDATAQDELARLHRRAAYFLALQLLGNRDDAMDVAQDAMLRLFTTLHRFDVRRPLRPWLYQIVRNRVVDLLRRRKIRCHDSLDAVDDEGNRRHEPADPTIDLDHDVDSADLRRRIWRALGALPHKQREILVLRDYQDLSYAEIAETLGIPIGTVMSRLHGARQKLRGVLKEQEAAAAAEPEKSPTRKKTASRATPQ